MLGQLRIVPATNLGDLEPQQSEAVVYDWKVSYSVLGSLPWLVLLLAFVIPKDNRNYRILFVLISLIVVFIFWWVFIKILPKMTSSNAIQFGTLFQSLAIGLTILWLIAHKFEKFGGLPRFFIAFAVMMVISFLGILSLYTDFENEVFLILALFAFMTIAMLLGFAMSVKLCRKVYRPKAFLLWLGLWLPLCCLFAMIGFVVVGMIITKSVPPTEALLLQIPIVGLFFGVFLYIVNLPFMILGFASPLYRERFCACLRLKPKAVTTEQGNIEPAED